MLTTRTLVTMAMAATLAMGCTTSDETDIEDTDVLQEALEYEDGLLGTYDEEPLFGRPDLYAELDLDGEDEAVIDEELAFGPIAATDPAERERRGLPVLLVWGQRHPAPMVAPVTLWNGAVSVTAGALVVERIVRFEGPSDTLLPRVDPQTVPFTSATRPHHDGLIVSALRPLPSEGASTEERASLVFSTAALAEPIVVDLAELAMGLEVIVPVDDLGNVVIISSVPDDPCPRGIVAGTWRRLRPGLGTLHGRFQGARGELMGHLLGIWGVTAAGEQRFVAKYISEAGVFRGLVIGGYNDGELRGRWISRDGEDRGVVGGRYTGIEEASGGRADGVFFGHWLEACGPTPGS